MGSSIPLVMVSSLSLRIIMGSSIPLVMVSSLSLRIIMGSSIPLVMVSELNLLIKKHDFSAVVYPAGRPGMSDVSLLSGISGLLI